MEPVWNQRIYYELLMRMTRGTRWLDVGCGRPLKSRDLQELRILFQEKISIGVDLDMASLKLRSMNNCACCNAANLPFPDNYFDVVSSNMVFEHLPNPLGALKEVWRVLSSGGTAIIHTPSSRHLELVAGRVISRFVPPKTYSRMVARYTGRCESDIFPTTYKANTVAKLRELSQKAGLHISLITHLRTPHFLPPSLRGMESFLSYIMPASMTSSILMICLKCVDKR